MKKTASGFLALILVCSIVFSLVACGNPAEESTQDTVQSVPASSDGGDDTFVSDVVLSDNIQSDAGEAENEYDNSGVFAIPELSEDAAETVEKDNIVVGDLPVTDSIADVLDVCPEETLGKTQQADTPVSSVPEDISSGTATGSVISNITIDDVLFEEQISDGNIGSDLVIDLPEVYPTEDPEDAGVTDTVINTDGNDSMGSSEPTVPETVGSDAGKTDSSVKQPEGNYNEGVVLVKFKDKYAPDFFGALKYISAEPLYTGSKWYTVKLADGVSAAEAVSYLISLDYFASVDYDYIMKSDAEILTVDVSSNPDYKDYKHHDTHKIPHGWEELKNDGKAPGGNSDVIVAVIDTGVDYNHLDLRNNIWINTAEIADNGIDDDGNGYIDDIYGWDCVGDDNDPMDDNGHGTHVAGIIVAENNDIGGVGVAYDCKVMVLKAGSSSGYFNNSDIAEAIQYAYMNGASVINMSFGGSFISLAVEEALESAYNACILVAAAGNDSACNDLSCSFCAVKTVSYPAALPYVIGVMSVDSDGSSVSAFSNYDHYPYDSVEYEVYAVGGSIHSTWPGNRYAVLNGTSMAAPTVSGIAALLRSAYSDREVYSTKFIQSQIVNTGTVNPYNVVLGDIDKAHSVADSYDALTRLPVPQVNLYDYHIDDSTAISSANNGNGIVDAGETVRLFISLHNRGGVASDVNVSVDTVRNGDLALTDPYFTIVNSTVHFSDIGTYSVREAAAEDFFEIIVSPDCPNDYLAEFNVHYSYKNGMDENDTDIYTDDGKQKARFTASRGYLLPGVISEDTTFKADKLYIVGSDVVIPEGVTVTFEEGCEMQFYDDREYYNSPRIIVYGNLYFNGSQEQMIKIFPNEKHSTYIVSFEIHSGTTELNYVDCVNLYMEDHRMLTDDVNVFSTIRNSTLTQKNGHEGFPNKYYNSNSTTTHLTSHFGRLIESNVRVGGFFAASMMHNNFIVFEEFYHYLQVGNFNGPVAVGSFNNNYVYCGIPLSPYDADRMLYLGQALEVKNNCFVTQNDHNLSSFSKILPMNGIGQIPVFSGNNFSKGYREYASQMIMYYYDSLGNPIVDVYDSCSDISLLWPHVISIEMFNNDGEKITTVGKEEIKVRVTFNRPMDVTKDTFLTFGTIEPYADYRIDGEYVSETVWEGTYTLKAQIENGQNFLKVNNACAKEDPTKKVMGEYHLYEFTVDTTAAMAMNLQAVALESGIQLTFAQDDYDTLLGYNIYRSEEKDGNFVKLNPTVLLPTESSFLDNNAEPGKTYWYTYTVVLSDFTESNPAGKVTATALDTQSPSLYHTPVNQAYTNNNLVISCIASDNVSINSVVLSYRTLGSESWKNITMVKQNDKYSATVFGSDVTLAGLEYYITATDGINTVTRGSSDAPYNVVVKSADTLTRMGDVDGNGTVTTKDALMLIQCLNGDLLLTDDAFKRADLNSDGILSSIEALRILQYVNGKVTSLDM